MSHRLPLILVPIAFGVGSCRTPATTPHSAEAATSRTVAFVCDGGEAISATYIDYRGGSTSFVVLHWNGKDYGLAQALSASGARYAGLYGPAPGGEGLEWWEAHGEARLGAFTGKDFSDTRPLLTGCRPQR
jgi:hypothetical protein